MQKGAGGVPGGARHGFRSHPRIQARRFNRLSRLVRVDGKIAR